MDWDEMARPWLEAAPGLEASFSEIFSALFDAAALQSGEIILDVGCGTGPTLVTAASAVGETGRIVGVDIAPPLVAAAAKRVPDNVELIVCDAGSHDYETATFDAIIANFGIMFFADNDAAFQNLRKAVKPGGRMVATFWASPPENPWFSEPRKIVDRFVEDVPRPDPAGPGPMRFADPTGLEAILKNAGWAPKIQTLDLSLTPNGTAEDAADLHMNVTVGMMLKGVDVSDDQLADIRTAIVEMSRDFEVENGLRVPARIHLLEATAV